MDGAALISQLGCMAAQKGEPAERGHSHRGMWEGGRLRLHRGQDEEHEQHEQYEQQHEQQEHRQHREGEELRSSDVVAALWCGTRCGGGVVMFEGIVF